MQDVARFMAFGTAVACMVGAAMVRYHFTLPTWQLFLTAGLIALVFAGLWGVRPIKRAATPNPDDLPKWIAKNPDNTFPRVGSRRWARAQYHSGNIDIAELNQFYAEHPEDDRDPDR